MSNPNPHQMPVNDLMQNRANLTRFAWLSIGAAVATIALKGGAYLLTGSVGLFSDAIESLVNLAGASMALLKLTIAARPADESHVYGHSKAEYFPSITEGLLILGAAIGIISAAIDRLLHPRELEQLGLGLAVSIAASTINTPANRLSIKADCIAQKPYDDNGSDGGLMSTHLSISNFVDSAL